MTGDDELERRLAEHFEAEGHVRAPDQLLGAVAAGVETTSQRRWTAVLPGLSLRRPRVAAVAVLAVVIVVVAVVRPGVAEPPGPGAAASAGATAEPRPLPLVQEASALEPGTYTLAPGFPVTITFDVPVGWVACSMSPVEQAVCGPSGSSVSFLDVVNVVSSPCSTTVQTPPVGPTVDDLVGAISDMDGFQATAPVDVTLDGHAGRQLTVTAPLVAPCDSMLTWATADRTNGVGAGEANDVRIFDVDGQRILIAGASFPTVDAPSPPTDLARILASVHVR